LHKADHHRFVVERRHYRIREQEQNNEGYDWSALAAAAAAVRRLLGDSLSIPANKEGKQGKRPQTRFLTVFSGLYTEKENKTVKTKS
jgi:hypothetical protein